MPLQNSRWANRRLLLEAFVLINLAFLSFDIYLAHSVNSFRREAEYIPLYFSLAAPVVLLIALAGDWRGYVAVWRDLGHFVGWLAVAIGIGHIKIGHTGAVPREHHVFAIGRPHRVGRMLDINQLLNRQL